MFPGGKLEWGDHKDGAGQSEDTWTKILIANFDDTDEGGESSELLAGSAREFVLSFFKQSREI